MVAWPYFWMQEPELREGSTEALVLLSGDLVGQFLLFDALVEAEGVPVAFHHEGHQVELDWLDFIHVIKLIMIGRRPIK